MKNNLQIYILVCVIIISIATKEITETSSTEAITNFTLSDIFISTSTLISDTASGDPSKDLTDEERDIRKIKNKHTKNNTTNNSNKKNTSFYNAIQVAALEGLKAMVKLYEEKEPEILRKGEVLENDSPGSKLSLFSAPDDGTEQSVKAAYASLEAAKNLKETVDYDFTGLSRQAVPKVSLRRTPLEGLCPSRIPPRCPAASLRYRTHDGTCNNARHLRWGSAQLPFNRFLSPDYHDGIERVRMSVTGVPLPSARFVSLLVHGARAGDAPVTMLFAQWGQFIDHDLTSTAQPRSINGTVPRCCDSVDSHPACLPISVPHDDPWLSPLGLKCLEFLRSAPAQRTDCTLSWREQTNQATSYLDASTVYSSSARSSDNSRIFRDGLLLFGRGPAKEDVCLRGALANQCIRPGDKRSGEQPGLLAMHTIWVGEHNRIAIELGGLNSHWSDEKIYQEARRIVGAMIQHITYREFLPLVLGKDVCQLFDLNLKSIGYYEEYDSRVNPTVANSFGAAAFRFGHSLVQSSLVRCDRNHRILENNVTLHDEFAHGDMGGTGSLHRLVRGLAMQRALKRDEFISPELTNHLFQTGTFPFGLDLAAINIQRGRDHGLPSYTSWRSPCGLSQISDWNGLEEVVGPRSTERIRQAYRSVDDIDLFVGGLAERPVVSGLVGPTFACIIAQQFSNIRKGDRFWYENPGFESSFTPAQLQSLRQVSFSQILCRALGGGTLQPNVFLPPDLPGNDRILCGSTSMLPIDLLPWTERDPFHKNIVAEPFSLSQPSQQSQPNIFSQQKVPSKIAPVQVPLHEEFIESFDQLENDGGVGDKLDFGESVNQNHKTNTTEIDNKLDFSSLVKPIKLRNPTSTTPKSINNKLDVKGKPVVTRRPILNNSHIKQNSTNKNTTQKNKIPARRKRPTNKNRRKTQTNQNANRRRDDYIYLDGGDNIGTIDLTSHLFTNQDNATKYWDNKAMTFGSTDKSNYNHNIDAQLNRENDDNEFNLKQITFSTPSPNSYNIEINIRPNPHSYHHQQHPLTTSTTKRPFVYQPNHNLPINEFNHLHNYHQSNTNFNLHRPTDYYDTTTQRPPTYITPSSYIPNKYSPSQTYIPNQFFTQQSYTSSGNKYSTPVTYNINKYTHSQSYTSSQFVTEQMFIENKLSTTPSYMMANKYSTPPSYSTGNKYASPFSYDKTTERYLPRPVSSSSSFSKRPFNWYEQQTTRKPELQTFFVVETTKYTTPIPIYSSMRPNLFSNSIRPNFNFNRKSGITIFDNSEPRLTFNSKQKEQNKQTADRKNYQIDDYDITTYASILNENNNNDDMTPEDSTKIQFDLDGYLRPDMHVIPFQFNRTKTEMTNNSKRPTKYIYQSNVLQKFVTPMQGLYTRHPTVKPTIPRQLNIQNDKTKTKTDVRQTVFSTSTFPRFPNGRPQIINDKLDTEFSDSIPRIPSFNIQSADYTDDGDITDNEDKDNINITVKNINTSSIKKPETNAIEKRAMVPLQILTKPERPDNWIMFDATIKEPLPEMPMLELDVEKSFSSEIPRPFFHLNKKKHT